LKGIAPNWAFSESDWTADGWDWAADRWDWAADEWDWAADEWDRTADEWDWADWGVGRVFSSSKGLVKGPFKGFLAILIVSIRPAIDLSGDAPADPAFLAASHAPDGLDNDFGGFFFDQIAGSAAG